MQCDRDTGFVARVFKIHCGCRRRLVVWVSSGVFDSLFARLHPPSQRHRVCASAQTDPAARRDLDADVDTSALLCPSFRQRQEARLAKEVQLCRRFASSTPHSADAHVDADVYGIA